MNKRIFNKFLLSDDSLWVYEGDRHLFKSNKGGILSLIEYINEFVCHNSRIIIFDQITGNAAALLSVKAEAGEVYSHFGSKLATKTLGDYGIKYHFNEIVPYIKNHEQDGMCPMERLSIGKNPDEFFELVRIQYNS
ncbi:DUF1893 domain-containing protein [Chloroflexota bacterium]